MLVRNLNLDISGGCDADKSTGEPACVSCAGRFSRNGALGVTTVAKVTRRLGTAYSAIGTAEAPLILVLQGPASLFCDKIVEH